jgi:hypothetical protein
MASVSQGDEELSCRCEEIQLEHRTENPAGCVAYSAACRAVRQRFEVDKHTLGRCSDTLQGVKPACSMAANAALEAPLFHGCSRYVVGEHDRASASTHPPAQNAGRVGQPGRLI